jgi:hypothetical protein
MSNIVQSDVLTTLAYLMGERTVNATTSAPRADFVQSTLNEVYQANAWRFAQANATLTIVSGIATLPSTFDIAHPINVSFLSGTTEIDLDEIDIVDRDKVIAGNRAYWLDTNGDDTYVLNTKDTDVSTVLVRFQKKPATLDSNGAVTVPYPRKMTIALGARRYVKLSQNPDADISQDEKLFEKFLADDIAAHQIPAPRKNRRTRQKQIGSHTGEF